MPPDISCGCCRRRVCGEGMRTDFKSSPARLHAAARRAPSCTRIARLAVSNASFARGAPIRCSVPANEAHQQCKPILDHCGHLSRVTLYLSCDALAVPRAQLKVTSTNDAAACGAHRSRTCGSVRAASEIVARLSRLLGPSWALTKPLACPSPLSAATVRPARWGLRTQDMRLPTCIEPAIGFPLSE